MKYDKESIFEKKFLLDNFDDVEKKLRETGEVLIISGSSLYRLSVTNANDLVRKGDKKNQLTLPQAMIKVIEKRPDKKMHAKDIADEITREELYFRKDGSFVTSVQVRACANNNKKLFECLDKNFIKIK